MILLIEVMAVKVYVIRYRVIEEIM